MPVLNTIPLSDFPPDDERHWHLEGMTWLPQIEQFLKTRLPRLGEHIVRAYTPSGYENAVLFHLLQLQREGHQIVEKGGRFSLESPHIGPALQFDYCGVEVVIVADDDIQVTFGSDMGQDADLLQQIKDETWKWFMANTKAPEPDC